MENNNEDKCIICHGTEQENLVQVNVCCGVQIIHTQCLHRYLTVKKICFVCRKNISDRVITDTKYRFDYSCVFGLIIIAIIIGTMGAGSKIIHNISGDYSKHPSFKFGISMTIIGNVAMFMLWLCSRLFLCPATPENDNDNLYQGQNNYYPIIKNKDHYYLWCVQDMGNQSFPCRVPYQLTKSQKWSVFMAKFIVGYSIGLCNTVANILLIIYYNYNGNMITGLWIYGGIITTGLCVPLIYTIIYPIIFCFSSLFYEEKVTHTIKQEYVTAYQRELIEP
jgi:hypothetical protein